ncbi:metal-dependent hydrolase [Halalkalicoccus jeotgali]|nr:metal-dependent hydrolase [Halalkalicoccus jeotgali]
MWPWEHALFAYLLYSIASRLWLGRTPAALPVLVLVVASSGPDLIDKPLAWQFGIFSSGYAIAHSVFFAVPLVALVGLLAWTSNRPDIGLAFGIGYLSHLLGDLLPIYVEEGEISLYPVIWPLGERSTTDHSQGFLDRVLELFGPYSQDLGRELLSMEFSAYTVFQLGIAALAVCLWLFDGAPVLREGYAKLRAHLAPDRARSAD